MSQDAPKLTAYALGELDESFELDSTAEKIVAETAFVANILARHLSRPRRRLRVIRHSLVALLLIGAMALSVIFWRSSNRQTVTVAPVDQPMVQMQSTATPILRLTPALAETTQPSSLTNATFRGIPTLDVEQLVAAVLQDASRVGSFTSLRLTPESAVVFQ